jgi:hypothetical protein
LQYNPDAPTKNGAWQLGYITAKKSSKVSCFRHGQFNKSGASMSDAVDTFNSCSLRP